MKKILITYASYGSGHKTIAEYIKNYLETNSEYEIKIIDILSYTGKVANISVNMFDYIYNHRMEKVFSFLYKSMDNKLTLVEYEWYFKRFIYNDRLKKEYKDFNPDIVLSTHFYGSTIAEILKKKKIINPKIISLVTDYKIHKFWLTTNDKEEIFIVANDIVKNEMIKKKCYTDKIYAFGLPYNIKLRISILPKREIYIKYNIDKHKKTILFYGGGSNGSEAYLKYLKTLAKLNLNYQILFICGRNEKLKEKATILARKYNNIKVFGFITNVYELLSICDFVITKPGGATVTECLEMQKYMLLLPGIGGQENYNAKFVSKNNYGKFVKNRLSFYIFLLMNVKYNDKYITNYNNNKINNDSLNKIKKLIDSL